MEDKLHLEKILLNSFYVLQNTEQKIQNKKYRIKKMQNWKIRILSFFLPISLTFSE